MHAFSGLVARGVREGGAYNGSKFTLYRTFALKGGGVNSKVGVTASEYVPMMHIVRVFLSMQEQTLAL